KTTDQKGRPLPLAPGQDHYRLAVTVDFEGYTPTSRTPTPRYAGTAELLVESDVAPNVTRQPQWRVVSLDLLSADDPAPDPRRAMMEGGAPGMAMPQPGGRR